MEFLRNKGLIVREMTAKFSLQGIFLNFSFCVTYAKTRCCRCSMKCVFSVVFLDTATQIAEASNQFQFSPSTANNLRNYRFQRGQTDTTVFLLTTNAIHLYTLLLKLQFLTLSRFCLLDLFLFRNFCIFPFNFYFLSCLFSIIFLFVNSYFHRNTCI